MYCPNCGKEIVSGSNFCSYCGSSLSGLSSSSPLLPTSNAIASSGSGDYRLVLVDRDNCSATVAENLLEDLLGYSAEDADQFVEMAPIEIADNLSALQARTLAQAFCEYGCQMSIIDENGDTVDLGDKALSSVYDNDGNLIEKAAAIIGALTVINQVTSYRRYKKPTFMDRLFHPRYVPVPPKPKRHHRSFYELLDPAPKPAQRFVRRSPAPRSHTPSRNSHRAPARKPGPKGGPRF